MDRNCTVVFLLLIVMLIHSFLTTRNFMIGGASSEPSPEEVGTPLPNKDDYRYALETGDPNAAPPLPTVASLGLSDIKKGADIGSKCLGENKMTFQCLGPVGWHFMAFRSAYKHPYNEIFKKRQADGFITETVIQDILDKYKKKK